jgi:hypothetical protein
MSELTERERAEQGKLMRTPMRDFPADLLKYIKAQSKIYGSSGDCVADWIAEWLVRQREPKP